MPADIAESIVIWINDAIGYEPLNDLACWCYRALFVHGGGKRLFLVMMFGAAVIVLKLFKWHVSNRSM